MQKLLGLVVLLLMTPISSAFAQGSIFGTVQNSNLTTPANGEISFYGFTNNTDDEIRLESSIGAGYDAGNWFDDFQNYLSKTPGNPYTYRFFNTVNGEGAVLASTIPNNSFQQENISLGTVAWPAAPAGMSARIISPTSVVLTWTRVAGVSYHVYRRPSTSQGSFFRIDNPAGLLTDAGEIDSFFVDNTVSGGGSYDYLLIGQNGAGQLGPHSAILTVSTATPAAPAIASITPNSGSSLGGTAVVIAGTGFDVNGATVTLDGAPLTSVTVNSPFQISAVTPAGSAGPADLVVTNTAAGLSASLPAAFTYLGNQAPILAAIGPRSVNEGANLNFGVTATDADGTTPTLTTTTPLPANATFVDNGNGTGTFNFNPNFTQSGSVNVTFYATDGIVIDSEVVTITINNVNQLPVLAAIGPRSVNEGANLNFGVSATDADGTTPILTTTTPLPANATFVDNGNGTGTFNFNPSFAQAGTFNITFYASDGTAIDSEQVVVTVTNVNQSPVLAAIGPRATTEGAVLNFGVSAADPDATTPILTTSALPTNASFTDNGNGTGTFNFAPDFTQAGPYSVTFYASDGTAIDSEVVAITVTGTNQDPILAAIGARSITEGLLLTFGVSASDGDGSTPTLTTSALPANATFLDNGNGTGTFNFTPSFAQAGPYSVTFYATDGIATDSEVVAITVNEAGNQAPVLANIGPRGVSEGNTLAFVISASDPDATLPTLTALNLPLNATLTDNGNGTANFSFTPDLTQSGFYGVTFIASDGALADTEIVAINVTETNQAPVLAAIGPQSVTEGILLSFGISATDGDGPIPTLTTSALPAGASFVNNGDGTGTFSWTPTFLQAGPYSVTFYATDGIVTADVDSEVVSITVNDAGNQTPVLAAIGARFVMEGATLNFTVTGSDADNTPLTLGTTALPTNATFVDNGDGTGSFSFLPDFTQAGSYPVTFFVSDGAAADSELVTITVTESGNVSPVIVAIPDTAVSEGGTLVINVTADDPDSPLAPAIGVSANTMRNFTFVDNGNGTAVLTYTPDFIDAGIDSIFFLASDGSSAPGTEIVRVTTNDVNQIPFFRAVTPKQVQVNDSLRFTITAVDSTDPGWPRRLFLTATGLPLGAIFTDNGNNTGSFRWAPNVSQIGSLNVTFYATDQGIPALAGTVVVPVTVVPVNNPPVLNLASAEARIVGEGQSLVVAISAVDPDGGAPSIEGQDLPANASIVPTGAGTANLLFNPDFTQGGNSGNSRLYSVTILASDGSATDRSVVTIQVVDAGNQNPVFDTVPTPSIVEGVTDTIVVHAFDPDGGSVTLTAINSTLPVNADFFDRGNGTGWIIFAPGFTQAGSFSIGIIANDGTSLDTAYVDITIVEAGNQPPVLATVADRTVKERASLVFRFSGTDPDGTRPLLSVSPLPVGAVVVDSGNGAASFTWVPTNFDAAVYPVYFRAEDIDFPGVFDSQLVVITVADSNIAPIIFATGGRTIFEGDTLRYVITSADEDLTFPNIRCRLTTADSLATNMTFFDSGNGVGVLTFIPNYSQGGTGAVGNTQILYNVYFIAEDETDPLLTTQTSSVQITVRHRNAPPNLVISLGEGPFTINEGSTLTFSVSASDPDGGLPTITGTNIPINATFAAGVLSRTFTFTPDFTQAGTFVVRFYATDAAAPPAVDSVYVTINVTDAGNQASRFTTTLPDTLNIASNFLTQIVIRATDPEYGTIALAVSPILPFGNFVDSGNGVGVYSLTPDSTLVGQLWAMQFTATDAQNAVTTTATNLRVVSFLRGDLDQNGRYTLLDLASLVNYLLRQGPPPVIIQTADVNADTKVDLSDLAFMINFLYEGGSRPPQ
ncbi:MAG: tandem-95 repeat protein [bacterium]|nr:tandem-95 repeat protein [bacterium]